MKVIPSWFLIGLAAAGSLYGQVRVSGSVRDESGGVPTGVTIQIIQRPALERREPFATAGRLPVPAPPFTATASVDASGSFALSNVPGGTYFVCAYPENSGLLSNCEWQTQYRPVTFAGTADVTLPALVLTRGTILRVEVHDLTGSLKSGDHHFNAGVITDAGYFAAARFVGTADTPQLFEVTIPNTAAVHLLIDSDLTVTDLAGKALGLEKQSDAVLHGGKDTTVAVSVK